MCSCKGRQSEGQPGLQRAAETWQEGKAMGVQVGRGDLEGPPMTSQGASWVAVGPGLGPVGEARAPLQCVSGPLAAEHLNRARQGWPGVCRPTLHGYPSRTSPAMRSGLWAWTGPAPSPSHHVEERSAPSCQHYRVTGLKPYGPVCAHPSPPWALEGDGPEPASTPPPGTGSACEGSICTNHLQFRTGRPDSSSFTHVLSPARQSGRTRADLACTAPCGPLVLVYSLTPAAPALVPGN